MSRIVSPVTATSSLSQQLRDSNHVPTSAPSTASTNHLAPFSDLRSEEPVCAPKTSLLNSSVHPTNVTLHSEPVGVAIGTGNGSFTAAEPDYFSSGFLQFNDASFLLGDGVSASMDSSSLAPTLHQPGFHIPSGIVTPSISGFGITPRAFDLSLENEERSQFASQLELNSNNVPTMQLSVPSIRDRSSVPPPSALAAVPDANPRRSIGLPDPPMQLPLHTLSISNYNLRTAGHHSIASPVNHRFNYLNDSPTFNCFHNTPCGLHPFQCQCQVPSYTNTCILHSLPCTCLAPAPVSSVSEETTPLPSRTFDTRSVSPSRDAHPSFSQNRHRSISDTTKSTTVPHVSELGRDFAKRHTIADPSSLRGYSATETFFHSPDTASLNSQMASMSLSSMAPSNGSSMPWLTAEESSASENVIREFIKRGIEHRCNVYVRGLPPSTTDESLMAMCAQ
jgi:hypothetical protein